MPLPRQVPQREEGKAYAYGLLPLFIVLGHDPVTCPAWMKAERGPQLGPDLTSPLL